MRAFFCLMGIFAGGTGSVGRVAFLACDGCTDIRHAIRSPAAGSCLIRYSLLRKVLVSWLLAPIRLTSKSTRMGNLSSPLCSR